MCTAEFCYKYVSLYVRKRREKTERTRRSRTKIRKKGMLLINVLITLLKKYGVHVLSFWRPLS